MSLQTWYHVENSWKYSTPWKLLSLISAFLCADAIQFHSPTVFEGVPVTSFDFLLDFHFLLLYLDAENDFYTDYVATRWYRAPELLSASTPDGKEYYGPGVDIWAVGCVFYECLNKSPLFPGKTDIDQLWLIEEAFGTGKREHVPDTPKIMAHDCRDDRIEYAARDNFAVSAG